MEPASVLDPTAKIALFMEDSVLGPAGKMGFGVLRYSSNPVVCIIDSKTAGQDVVAMTGIPRPCPIVSSVDEANRMGAEVLVLGIAPSGGAIPNEWWPLIEKSLNAGLSVVNGLHDLVSVRFPGYASDPSSAKQQFIWDIRIEPTGLHNGTGLAANVDATRLLLVGTDMAVGKMTVGLEVFRVAKERGIKSGFVATGQIGILITGSGIPLDAVRVDFASGAVEREVVRHGREGAKLIVVEGQGSLVHPSSTANLPLMRGTCPTHLILCHRAGQTHLRTISSVEIPPLPELARLNEDLASACGVFPRPKTVAVALNTVLLNDEDAQAACVHVEAEMGVPCVDPIRHGPERLVDALGLG